MSREPADYVATDCVRKRVRGPIEPLLLGVIFLKSQLLIAIVNPPEVNKTCFSSYLVSYPVSQLLLCPMDEGTFLKIYTHLHHFIKCTQLELPQSSVRPSIAI